MSKKWKIILVIIASTVILGLGGGAIVMAADNTTPTTTTPAAQSNTLFAKVATILGVSEQDLTAAIKKANTQLETQKLNQLIDQAVTNKAITPDEAIALNTWLAQRPDPATATKDAMKTWQQSQPKVAKPGALKWLLAGPKVMMGSIPNDADLLNSVASLLNVATGKQITADQIKSAFTQAESQMKEAALDNTLANAVKNGKINQTESDQIKSWWNSRPSGVDKLMPNGGFGVPGLGGGGMKPGFHGMMPGKRATPVQPITTTKPAM